MSFLEPKVLEYLTQDNVKKSKLRHLWQVDKHSYSCLGEIWWALGNPNKRFIMFRPMTAILVYSHKLLFFCRWNGQTLHPLLSPKLTVSWRIFFLRWAEGQVFGAVFCVRLVSWIWRTCQCANQSGKMPPGQTSKGHPSVSVSISLSLALFETEH